MKSAARGSRRGEFLARKKQPEKKAKRPPTVAAGAHGPLAFAGGGEASPAKQPASPRTKPAGQAGGFSPQLLAFQERCSSALARLRALYLRLPALPYLDRQTTAILLVSFALYALFALWVMLSNPVGEMAAIVQEAQLVKNSRLMLLPGEYYEYEFSSPTGFQRIGYQVSKSSQCNGTLVSGGLSSQRVSACLSPSGNLAGDYPQFNSSLGNQSMPLFSPWMLAVSDNFSWQVNTSMSIASAKVSLPTTFRSLGKKIVAGRSAFEIVVESEIGQPSRYYVDAEKRVLLYADFGNVTAKLVSAPFPLGWQEK